MNVLTILSTVLNLARHVQVMMWMTAPSLSCSRRVSARYCSRLLIRLPNGQSTTTVTSDIKCLQNQGPNCVCPCATVTRQTPTPVSTKGKQIEQAPMAMHAPGGHSGRISDLGPTHIELLHRGAKASTRIHVHFLCHLKRSTASPDDLLSIYVASKRSVLEYIPARHG